MSLMARRRGIRRKRGSVIFEDDFERASFAPPLSGETTNCAPWDRLISQTATSQTTIETDQVRSGTRALKMFVQDEDASTFGFSGIRAQTYKAALFTPEKDYWIATSMYFPPDHPVVTIWCNILQIGYNRQTACPVKLMLAGGHRFVVSDEDSTTYWITPAGSDIRGQWHDFVFHILFSSDPAVGYVEIWLNGVRQTFINGSQRRYFSTLNSTQPTVAGDYHINHYRDRTQFYEGTIYFDRVKIGTSYDAVTLDPAPPPDPEGEQQTFSIAASTDDQRVSRSLVGTWPVTGAVSSRTTNGVAIRAGQEYSSGTNTYTTYNALLRWNTSSLPDGATVTGATLRFVAAASVNSPNSHTFVGEWSTWDGTSGTDFNGSVGTSAFSGNATNTYTSGTTYNIPLTDAAANVSLTGTTRLRLGSSGVQPTGFGNGVDIASFDNVSGFAVPQLIVDYV